MKPPTEPDRKFLLKQDCLCTRLAVSLYLFHFIFYKDKLNLILALDSAPFHSLSGDILFRLKISFLSLMNPMCA